MKALALEDLLFSARRAGKSLPPQLAARLFGILIRAAGSQETAPTSSCFVFDAEDGLVLDLGETDPAIDPMEAAVALGRTLLAGPRGEVQGPLAPILRRANQGELRSLGELHAAVDLLLPGGEPRDLFAQVTALHQAFQGHSNRVATAPIPLPPRVYPAETKQSPAPVRLPETSRPPPSPPVLHPAPPLAELFTKPDPPAASLQPVLLEPEPSLAQVREVARPPERPPAPRTPPKPELSSPRAAPESATAAEVAALREQLGRFQTSVVDQRSSRRRALTVIGLCSGALGAAAATVLLLVRAGAASPPPAVEPKPAVTELSPAAELAIRTATSAAEKSAAAADRAAGALDEMSKRLAAAPAPVPPAPAPVTPASATVAPAPAAHRTRARGSGDVDRGERALRKGKLDEAVAAFEAALRTDPSSAPAVRGLAMVHMTQGREADARREFDRYLTLAPRAPDAARIRKVVANLGDAR